MQVRGGYIVVGVDNRGGLTGALDGVDTRPFDEANLVPRLLRYLSPPLELRTRVTTRDGHTVVLIYVGPHPTGCAFFHSDGQYTNSDKDQVVFRSGDVFWRDGTRSVRMSQQGLEEVIRRRISTEKRDWLEEQHEIRRREREDLEASYEGRQLTDEPLGAVSLDLEISQLRRASLELLRRGDSVGLRHVLLGAVVRARDLIERDAIEAELSDLVDKLACLGADFLEYEADDWFLRIVDTLAEVYSLPVRDGDVERFGYSTFIDPGELAPRVWLIVIQRVFALGALAVRRRDWRAVRALAVKHPDKIGTYDPNWLRHAVTMLSRAQHLSENRGNQNVRLSLLSLARSVVGRLECLRPDLAEDDDAVLTSLAQFDVLAGLAEIDAAGSIEGRVFYPNFARFRQDRVQPTVERLLTDQELRGVIFTRSDDELAVALADIGRKARNEGAIYDGFRGWSGTPVEEFIARHRPPT